jgi:hypothetical protein
LVVVVEVGIVVVVVVGAPVVDVAGTVVVVVDGAMVVVVVVLAGEVSAEPADSTPGGVVEAAEPAAVETSVALTAPAGWLDVAQAGTKPWTTIATTAATATAARRVERKCSFTIMPTTRRGSACDPAERRG